MTDRIQFEGLQIAGPLYDLVNDEILLGTAISAEKFWNGFAQIVADLSPKNRNLLDQRDHIQTLIDTWHRENPAFDEKAYYHMLKDIGYWLEEGDDFSIGTESVDREIADIAGPQLVVPVSNARFALNAANARWVSLYDALYGSDVIETKAVGGQSDQRGLDLERAEKVTREAAHFLDKVIPLLEGSHADVVEYKIEDGSPTKVLQVTLSSGVATQLRDTEKFVGFSGVEEQGSLLFKNNQLHIEIKIDRTDEIGKRSRSGINDIVMESAITTIQDCEDSVAAVDTEDKVRVYRNWLGLMTGRLKESFVKNHGRITRHLNPDKEFTTAHGETMQLPGRSLLLVRNVGHLMTTPAILDSNGEEIFEGFLDAMVTSACALHDLRAEKNPSEIRNSRTGSVYIVKPKMHGPVEVAFTNELFNRVEDVLELPRYTLKIGVMDEERRTTINLKECIRAVKDRIVFINTGFLDRTGDEIHTSMEAGPVCPKEKIKSLAWISAYENWNVDIGIACGFPGRAQIGKGMWPKPDEMKQMMEIKIAHPQAGANCAWVPSPTAASLHAMHYHLCDVKKIQNSIRQRKRADIYDILQPPLLNAKSNSAGEQNHKFGLSEADIMAELENNAQGILGYVVRWIDQGVGCSKVPDSNNVGLMEDRATLRISSQHMANWLRHGICNSEQIKSAMKKMAVMVDRQNENDPEYHKMAPGYGGIAYQTACDLVFEGCKQPNGYTEPLLHKARGKVKKIG